MSNRTILELEKDRATYSQLKDRLDALRKELDRIHEEWHPHHHSNPEDEKLFVEALQREVDILTEAHALINSATEVLDRHIRRRR